VVLLDLLVAHLREVGRCGLVWRSG
jgi:hypothetical protein